MSSASSGGSGCGPFFSLLGIVFIVLKLTDVIAWSWWWVLSPFIFQFVLFFVVAVVVIAGLVAMKKANDRDWRRKI